MIAGFPLTCSAQMPWKYDPADEISSDEAPCALKQSKTLQTKSDEGQ